MADSLSPLVTSKAKLRAAAKGLTSNELEKIIEGLTTLMQSARKNEDQKLQQLKKSKIAKIKALMNDAGLELSDLSVGTKAKSAGRSKRSKKKVPAKYRLVVDGEEHLWTGRGRPPKTFKEYFDSGKGKESCLIK